MSKGFGRQQNSHGEDVFAIIKICRRCWRFWYPKTKSTFITVRYKKDKAAPPPMKVFCKFVELNKK